MTAAPRPARDRRPNHVFVAASTLVLVADVVTKYIAHTRLSLHQPIGVVGDALRWTLTYNPGAAFGLSLGTRSRWLFVALALAVTVALVRQQQATRPGAWPRALALGLMVGGAVANVVNRLWSARGVVDFIDVGVRTWRWPTYNVADIGVSVGAVLLVWTLSREASEGDVYSDRTPHRFIGSRGRVEHALRALGRGRQR